MLQPCHVKPIEVVADGKHPGQYRLRWADGVLSQWGYNLTRANDILRHFDGYVDGMRRAEELRARSMQIEENLWNDYAAALRLAGLPE